MVNVRKRGKVYEYRFKIATVEGTRKWITKSGYPTKSDAFKEGAKAYNFNLKYSNTISYLNIIKNHVKPKIGFYTLSQLDTRLLQEFINNIYVEYAFSKNYMHSILKVIKGSIKYACYTFLVFVKENGLFLGTETPKYAFKVIHYELGINSRFHDFRDTHATRLIESGADIK